MDVRSVKHKGLLRFLQNDDPGGLKPDHVPRIRRILTALISAPNIDAFTGPLGWRIHQLKGDRQGIWSVSVTGNWRLTFRVDGQDIHDLDYEDYH